MAREPGEWGPRLVGAEPVVQLLCGCGGYSASRLRSSGGGGEIRVGAVHGPMAYIMVGGAVRCSRGPWSVENTASWGPACGMRRRPVVGWCLVGDDTVTEPPESSWVGAVPSTGLAAFTAQVYVRRRGCRPAVCRREYTILRFSLALAKSQLNNRANFFFN